MTQTGAPPIGIDLLSSLSGVTFQQAVTETNRVEIVDEILSVIGSETLRQNKQVKGVAKPSAQSGRLARCGARASASWGCSTTCSVRRVNIVLNQMHEQIAGWLRRTDHETARMQMSDETRYKSSFVRARGVLKKKLAAHLRTYRKTALKLKRYWGER